MKTDPLTGSRYPETTDGSNVAQYFQNLAWDLADNAIPSFATTAARDTAYSTWVAAGNAMRNGLLCHVSGMGFLQYLGGAWVPLLGVVGYGSATVSSATFTTEGRITGSQNINLSLQAGHAYRIKGRGRLTTSSSTGAVVTLSVRCAITNLPTTSAPAVGTVRRVLTAAAELGSETAEMEGLFTVATSGSYWLSPFLGSSGGSGQLIPDERGRADFWVEEAGPAPAGILTV